MPGFTGSGGAAYMSKKDDWETPDDLFFRVNSAMNFTLDAASSDKNAKCENHFTIEDDALTQEWRGVVWLNPPYGRGIGDWVRKAYEESQKGAIVVMLIPARTDTSWCHDYVSKAQEVVFLRGRVKFCVDREPQGSAPFPSMLVRFGGGDAPMLSSIGRAQAVDQCMYFLAM